MQLHPPLSPLIAPASAHIITRRVTSCTCLVRRAADVRAGGALAVGEGGRRCGEAVHSEDGAAPEIPLPRTQQPQAENGARTARAAAAASQQAEAAASPTCRQQQQRRTSMEGSPLPLLAQN